jgi:hypothetical protein
VLTRPAFLDAIQVLGRYTSKDGAAIKNFPALEWLAAMCSHIPNRGEQMVRYYERFEFSKIWLGFHFMPDFLKNRDWVENITGRG